LIHTHFNDGRLMPGIQPQECFGDTNGIIKVSLRLQHAPTRCQHSTHHFLRGGFSIAPRDGHDRNGKPRSMKTRQVLVGPQSIFHLYDSERISWLLTPTLQGIARASLLNDDTLGPFFPSTSNKFMSIKILAF
jgi:hypothetical protein